LDACTTHTKDGAHATLSLLRGDEPYKHHWRPEPVVNGRLLLARRRTAPLLAAALADAAARRRGRELLRRRGRDAGGGPWPGPPPGRPSGPVTAVLPRPGGG